MAVQYTSPRVWVAGEVVTASQMNTYISDNMNASFPVGSYQYLVTNPNPNSVESIVNGGWLEANGAAVSRTTYSTLFGVIGGLFGTGDGVTTFNLPDFAGRIAVGRARTGGHADVVTLGQSDGAALANRRPTHWHDVLDGGVLTVWDGGAAAPSSYFPSGQANTGGNKASTSPGRTAASPKDTPAYLVAGIWVIKF